MEWFIDELKPFIFAQFSFTIQTLLKTAAAAVPWCHALNMQSIFPVFYIPVSADACTWTPFTAHARQVY